MTEQVTKTKSEGRVAAGKRLVEWNRKNKENLVKNREKVVPSDSPSASSSRQEPQSHHTVLYSGGVTAILILAGGALYLHTRRAPPATLSTSVKPSLTDNDIFRMN